MPALEWTAFAVAVVIVGVVIGVVMHFTERKKPKYLD